jgi:Dickkopf N-terminal cysteine-rich region
VCLIITLPVPRPPQFKDIKDKIRSQGFTGASCEVASDCYSYICSTPVCIGTPSNEYCPNDESCLPGYYCDRDAYTCQPSLSPGDPCSYDNECPVGYGCNLGTCILYFSLKKGSQASQNKVCKSNWVYKGQCDSVLIYKNGAVLQPPYNCKIGEMCSYVSYNTKATFDTQPCVCSGILNKGGGYCSNYLEWAEDLIQENFVYLSYTYSGCSGNYSHTDDPGVLLQCGSITQQQHDYMYNMQGQARYWNLYQSQAISSCSDALGLFNSSYTSLLYTYGLIHKMSLMFILMLYI